MRLKTKFKLFGRLNLKRALAYLIDLFSIELISGLMARSYIKILYILKPQDSYISYQLIDHAIDINFTIIYLTYFTTCFYLYEGVTIGLKLFNLQIKRSCLNPRLDFFPALNRSMASFISYKLNFVLFLLPIFRDDNKGLSDLASKSQTCFFSVFKHETLEKPLGESSEEKAVTQIAS